MGGFCESSGVVGWVVPGAVGNPFCDVWTMILMETPLWVIRKRICSEFAGDKPLGVRHFEPF